MPARRTKLSDLRYQFLRPFAFLSVRGPSLHVYRLTLPLITTLVSCGAAWLLPAGVNTVGDHSVAYYLATFFVALPGFFVAALAAVVAFNGGDLDREMPDVKAKITAFGDTVLQSITLRIFLCYLFAYLTVLSFIGFFACLGATELAPSVQIWLGHLSPDAAARVKLVCQIVFTGLSTFISASVVFCTGQGLYFLAERVHQELLPDRRTGPEDKNTD